MKVSGSSEITDEDLSAIGQSSCRPLGLTIMVFVGAATPVAGHPGLAAIHSPIVVLGCLRGENPVWEERRP